MTFGLEGVSVAFGSRRALHEVTVPVVVGQVTAVIGADGAGKTTTARTLVGLVDALEGRVRRPDRARMGYQPAGSGTWQDLTVIENLQFVAATHASGAVTGARIDGLLETTALTAARDRLAGQLSGGMRQKLAVAMAMLARPVLLVLDEPTTGLDPASRVDLWRLLAHATGEGMAVLATTAYLDEAQRANHVVVLDEGRVLVSGPPRRIPGFFPGSLVATTAPIGDRSWRRGRSWRTWVPPGQVPPVGAEPLHPGLEDVVIVTAMAGRGGNR